MTGKEGELHDDRPDDGKSILDKILGGPEHAQRADEFMKWLFELGKKFPNLSIGSTNVTEINVEYDDDIIDDAFIEESEAEREKIRQRLREDADRADIQSAVSTDVAISIHGDSHDEINSAITEIHLKSSEFEPVTIIGGEITIDRNPFSRRDNSDQTELKAYTFQAVLHARFDTTTFIQ